MGKHVYIITGASSGLGAALSRQLLSVENHVYGLSRTENKEIQRIADDAGFDYKFVSFDLSKVDFIPVIIQSMFHSIASENVQTITLINNAATVTPIKHIQECTQNEIITAIQLNLTAPILLTSLFMKETKGWNAIRTIVNISSGSAQYPASSMSLYCSTKSALNMFTQCVGLEQAEDVNPVNVLTIDPGMMDTGMQQAARVTDFELSSYFTKQKEEGNLAEPEAVARKILFEIQSAQNLTD